LLRGVKALFDFCRNVVEDGSSAFPGAEGTAHVRVCPEVAGGIFVLAYA